MAQRIEEAPLQDLASQPTISKPQITQTGEHITQQVVRYKTWLDAQTKRNNELILHQKEEYAERASRIVEVGNRRIQTFAPFRYKYSALQTITMKQRLILAAAALLWIVGLVWQWKTTLALTITLITLGYLLHLFLDVILAIGAFRNPAEEHIDDEVVHALQDAQWPQYTILCPLYCEAQVVPQFVKAMQELDYPEDKLQILFLTEADDGETRTAIRALHLPSHFHIVTVPDGSPRTKPRACNYGLIEATGQYVVIYDAEDVPDPLQLKKAVLTFANHDSKIACVQAKLNFYNPNQNLLTRWFTAEYSLWFDLILPGLQYAKLAIPLGGTSNHFPTQTLRALGGWDAFNVTEDCDLGLRLSWFRLETVVLDSTTYEEANSRTKNWIRQRSRWIKGYMQTYLVHMREPLHYAKSMRMRELISLQLVIGGKAAVLFLNPIMWLLLLVSLIFRQQVSQAYNILFPTPILYMSAICLILGNFFYFYTYLLGCMKRKQYHLVKWMLLIPIYWVMGSIAASMALYQLITKPHYWEKTIHGLHLSKTTTGPEAEPAKDMNWEELAQLAEDLTPVPTEALIHGEGTPAHIQKYDRLDAVPVASVQDTLEEMITPQRSAFLPSERAALHRLQHVQKDRWLIATVITTCLTSILSCWYFFQQHQILLYSAATFHLNIAHSVLTGSNAFDITRLGGTFLPLPHLLMLPFVWNTFLWQTGLAGSLPSMLAYVVTSICVFLSVRRLTKHSPLSFVAAMFFAFNPNILYLQAMPLSTLVGIATLAIACTYFLAWAQTARLKHLLMTAGSTCLATLAHYDAWALFLTFLVMLIVIGKVKRQERAQIESNVLVFSLLGGLGIGLWLLWDANTFGSPLYFLQGLSTLQQQGLPLYAYQALWQFLHFNGLDVSQFLETTLIALVLLALAICLVRDRRKPELYAALAFLMPLGIYALALYAGFHIVPSSLAVAQPPLQQALNLVGEPELAAPITIIIALSCGGWHRKRVVIDRENPGSGIGMVEVRMAERGSMATTN